VDKEVLLCMSESLKHRGPNAQGYFSNGNIGMGALRLSILDLSDKGNQPMFSKDKRFCIVYNGEVYNYIEIRNELKPKYDFISNSDTEVVLYSFIEWGESCLNKFNGMFAFAILDIDNNVLFLARDRFGIKPLYYYLSRDAFIFSSELKSFKYILKNREVDEKIMYNYLVFNRTDYDENTFLKGVKKLPHGYKLLIKDNNFSLSKWYNLKDNLKNGYTCAEELKENLVDSIRLHLRSDVPLGVCLSGGLDSSTLVSTLLKELKITDLQTFSAVYGKNKYGDESEYIDEFKDGLGQNLYKTYLTADNILNDIDDFIYYIDEPVPQISPLIHYKVMKLAKEHVRVLLDGQGGDEQFAGYHYFFGTFFKELLSEKKFITLAREIFYYCLRHKSSLGLKSFLYFLLPGRIQSKVKLSENNSLSLGFLSQFKQDLTVPDILYKAQNLHSSLIEHFEYKLEHLLKWEDRNSMRFSLESRVPFLDHYIVENVLSSSSSLIINKGENKWLLRKAMKNILPDKIMNRQDKIGFDNPCAEWFREAKFKEFILSILNSNSFRNLQYFDYKRCLKIYQIHLKKKIDASRQIWKWINVSLWQKKFIA
jgi:asparagine synthase (glutamine-hydrolysing)